MTFSIPGGRLAAESAPQAARLAAGAGWFFGPWAWRIGRAGRSGDRTTLHRLERQWGASVSKFLGIEWDMAGLEHLTPARRYILLPLHEGFADALALLRLGPALRFVARDELFEWPTLGRYLRDSGQVLIDTTHGRTAYRHLQTAGGSVLNGGEALVVFPQGSILGIEVAFWHGAFRLAERLDAWIVPVVLSGSHRVWEYPYSPIVRFNQRMSVRVLPPVPPERAVTEARATEREMKRVALAGSMTSVRRFRPELDGFWDDYRYEIDPDFPALKAAVSSHRRMIGGSPG